MTDSCTGYGLFCLCALFEIAITEGLVVVEDATGIDCTWLAFGARDGGAEIVIVVPPRLSSVVTVVPFASTADR